MATPVTVEFIRLFCYHGVDEDVSEPYLWVIGFTLDGRTITHTPDSPKLTGAPDYFFSPGSHDNIGGGMGIGSTRLLPPAVGTFATTLQPIVLNAGGQAVEVPGWIGLIGVLLEEDSTSDVGAEAAHQAINNLVRTEINEAVEDINLAGLGAEILAAVNAGTSPVAAATAIFTAKIDRLIARIERYAQSAAVNAIVSNLSFPAAIVEGADPDEFMGISVRIYGEPDLAATTHTERLEFTDMIVEPNMHPESSDFAYNLHGQAWQRIEVFWVPFTDQVPPGRWQVTGLQRSGRPGKQFISQLGGNFADGTPWVQTKGAVMDQLSVGSHSYFVRGASGVEADVIIEPEPLNPFFPSLTTTADDDPTNNLGSLPPCPLGTRHTRPVG
ncbi:hypothetical protein [Nocardioides euryhalodurans]|uniref:Uncharacterized protein n=1 Tax=Nocardioides euryhalodurans TaxID=2518370 RepID=A0A4P7GMD1_9ACTN|nr:hypothetical protein [Nocardioides euryhalodurans]QBR92937.1 hypothetical protein EXE57_12145 [Nocardioides euryhalodurans]